MQRLPRHHENKRKDQCTGNQKVLEITEGEAGMGTAKARKGPSLEEVAAWSLKEESNLQTRQAGNPERPRVGPDLGQPRHI